MVSFLFNFCIILETVAVVESIACNLDTVSVTFRDFIVLTPYFSQ